MRDVKYRDLKYYEQNVNSRFMASAPPAIDESLLPETAKDIPLLWRRIPERDLAIFDDGSDVAGQLRAALTEDGNVFVPIHPIEADRWPGEEFRESGTISVSASYRTVFFQPEKGGLLADQVGDDAVLMMKLHLERPLPGIAGDRRLSRQIAQKCVTLSTVLPQIMYDSSLGSGCEVLPEFLAMSSDETGVIYRRIPGSRVLPVFSLFSPDPDLADAGSHLEAGLRRMFGDDAARAAASLGDLLARPLLGPLFTGFREGFSIEMHAQNVLFRPGDETLIDRVYVRDMEGVVFSNRYRIARGLDPLFEGLDNAALISDYRSMTRWFNRNVDLDVGKVFTASLAALETSGYFAAAERKLAIRSIRTAARQCVRESGVDRLNLPGRLLPISRSPYGNGLSKGHYYRTRYR